MNIHIFRPKKAPQGRVSDAELIILLIFFEPEFFKLLGKAESHTEKAEIGGVAIVNGSLASAKRHKLGAADEADILVAL